VYFELKLIWYEGVETRSFFVFHAKLAKEQRRKGTKFFWLEQEQNVNEVKSKKLIFALTFWSSCRHRFGNRRQVSRSFL
jgi:hypothetical protein